MDVDPAPPNDAQMLRDVRKRFYDMLFNYSVFIDPETSQATSAASNAGSQAGAMFPYRHAPCATCTIVSRQPNCYHDRSRHLYHAVVRTTS